MGGVAGVAKNNKEFQSVVPSAPNNSTQASILTHNESNRKRKLAATTTLEPEGKQPLGTVSTPLTVLSDSLDRSESYRSNSSEYDQTEGQMRREGMADCEFECSQVSKYLYLGGQRVAENLELLKEKKITRIINCASAVVPNFHEGYSDIKYLTLNLVDGKVEDISWFVCEVIQFIFEGANEGQKTLLHCEKGISRSCSFAIAYRMWSTGEKWKTAFEYIQKRRKICSPTTAFVCNLIELGEIFSGSSAEATLLFRCSYHAAYDHNTPVLKLCRNLNSRRILVPSTSLLNPKGIYILRAVKGNKHHLYLWRGRLTKDSTVEKSIKLATMMVRVFSNASSITKIIEGEETDEFLSFLLKDGPFKVPDDNSASYDDFYDFPPSQEQIEAAVFSTLDRRETNSSNILYSLGMRTNSPNIEPGNNRESTIRSTMQTRNGDQTPRSRSASRERTGRVQNNINGRKTEAEPVSIQLPPALSRTNSFRSTSGDGDGPVINSKELLDRINNIISTADVGSAASSRKTTPQPAQTLAGRKPSIPQVQLSQPIPSKAPMNMNLNLSAASNQEQPADPQPVQNSQSIPNKVVPPMNMNLNLQSMPSNSAALAPVSVPPASASPTKTQPAPALQLNNNLLSNNNNNASAPPLSARPQQNIQAPQTNKDLAPPNSARQLTLSLNQVPLTNIPSQPSARGQPQSPGPPQQSQQQQQQAKKKQPDTAATAQTQLKLPPILNRNGSAGELGNNSSNTATVTALNFQLNKNQFNTNSNNNLQTVNNDEFDDPMMDGDGSYFVRSGSKSKILPLAEVVGISNGNGLTPSRPTSAEKKSFGVSPRVAPLLTKGTAPKHMHPVVPLNLGNVSLVPPEVTSSTTRTDEKGNGTVRSPEKTGELRTPHPPLTQRPSSASSPPNNNSPRFSKPLLFQLSKKRTDSGSSVSNHASAELNEWRAMGVYDDGDLDDVSLFLFFVLFLFSSRDLYSSE